MRIQLRYDHLIVAEGLASVADTALQRCSECGALKQRRFLLEPTTEGASVLRATAATRLEVILEPE